MAAPCKARYNVFACGCAIPQFMVILESNGKDNMKNKDTAPIWESPKAGEPEYEFKSSHTFARWMKKLKSRIMHTYSKAHSTIYYDETRICIDLLF